MSSIVILISPISPSTERGRDQARPAGVVHIRDTVGQAPGTTAGNLMRPALTLPADTPVYAALTTMREHGTRLVLVTDGELLGLVTLQDLVNRLLAAPNPA